MKEADFMRLVMKRASDLDARLWRNNVAQAWVGESLRRNDGSIVLKNPRPLHAGLCQGSSDLIGFVPVKVTEDMVGKTVAIFAAVETKTIRGRLTSQQAAFIEMVNKFGGVAGVAREDGDLERIFSRGLTPRS